MVYTKLFQRIPYSYHLTFNSVALSVSGPTFARTDGYVVGIY